MAAQHSNIPPHVKETVASIVDLHLRADEDLNRHQRWIERLTAQLGRPRSLYAIVAIVAVWIGGNLALIATGHVPFDHPPFQWLQGLITLAALVVATMVLTTQNRQHEQDARRDRLALHVNMVAEAEVTKLIALVEELRRDMPDVPNRHDPEAEAMQKPVDAVRMVSELEQKLDAGAGDG